MKESTHDIPFLLHTEQNFVLTGLTDHRHDVMATTVAVCSKLSARVLKERCGRELAGLAIHTCSARYYTWCTVHRA